MAGARIDRNKLEQLVWAEEVADVKIMQEQLQIMFDLAGKVKGHEAAKVERLRERLGGDT